MSETVTVVDLATAAEQLSQLLDAAIRGETIVVAGEGDRRVQLVLVEEPPTGWYFGWARGRVFMADDFDDPLPDFEEYMR